MVWEARTVRVAIALVVTTVLIAPGAGSAAATDARVAIFFYPWYGTPQLDGEFRHWQQRGHEPPRTIASAFYPARGVYSSSDAGVLAAQLREIRAAGVDDVVVSWWGRGSPEDARLDGIVATARRFGLDVAAHVEPYPARTPASVAADLVHLSSRGITDFYVYGAEASPAADWAAALQQVTAGRVFAHTVLVGFAARGGFDGFYTYDVLIHGGWKFARLCAQARRVGLLCAPSVGPGYDARRSVGDPWVKPRRRGATYDGMWRAARQAGADVVTITSYNEWHEGTQIEPARRRAGYASYEGAWGRTGAAASRAYLDRTRYWARAFRRG